MSFAGTRASARVSPAGGRLQLARGRAPCPRPAHTWSLTGRGPGQVSAARRKVLPHPPCLVRPPHCQRLHRVRGTKAPPSCRSLTFSTLTRGGSPATCCVTPACGAQCGDLQGGAGCGVQAGVAVALTRESLPLTGVEGVGGYLPRPCFCRGRVPAAPWGGLLVCPLEPRKGGPASETDGQAHVPMAATVNCVSGP